MLTLARKKGGESYVNSQTANLQARPAVAPLAGGGFVVVWADESHVGGDASVSAVKAQLYDSAGAKVGGELLVNSFTSAAQAEPSVAALASGGFVVTWTNSETSVALGGDGSDSSIKGQMFSAAGAKLGGEFLVNGGSSSFQEDSHVFALPNGGFAVAWWDRGTFNIFAKLYDSAGAAVTGDLLVSNDRQGNQSDPVGVAYGADRFVILWSHQDFGPTFDRGVYGQIFDLAGNKIGGEFSVSTVIADIQAAPDVAALAGGGFVAVWESLETDYGTKAQIFDANGNKAGPELAVSQAGNSVARPSVTGLPGGGYLVGWENLNGGTWSERGQLFDGQGSRVGQEFQINSEPTPFDSRLDVATLASGEVAAVWINENGGNAEQLGVKLQLLLPPTMGTPLADLLAGTRGDDAIAGLGGDDEIDGGAGNDLIEGNGGDDLIFGGAGNDSLDGGDGVDLLHGRDGDDALSGGAGNDLLRGYAGVDHYDGGDDDGASFHGLYGDGISFFDARATQGVVADLGTGIVANDGYGNVETMVNVESLSGDTAFIDTYYGNDSSNGLQGGRGDNLYGFGGDDVFDLRGAAATVDGGSGIDRLRLYTTLPYFVPDTNGDGNAELGPAMPAGYTVNLAAGTVRDGFGLTGTVNGIENLAGSDLADDLRGDAGDNIIEGGIGNDVLRLQDGGADSVFAGEGNDNIFFIGSLNSADVVDGGAGVDTIVLQGNYPGGLTLGSCFGIENVSILGGNNTNFGEPGTNRYDYVLTTVDGNFAAGVQARINGAALLEGEDFTFDGNAETNASFVVYGGKGTDTFTGGLGNDIFFFAEERFATGDTVNGGPGYDGMFLRGNYTIDFNAPGYTGLFTNIENLTLTSATDERYARGGGSEFDYNLTLSNALVGAGQTLTVSGALLMATETMVLDGSQESDGILRLFGGAAADSLKGGGQADLIHGVGGADILSGGGGADVFRYQSTAESNTATMDHILDFTPGTDKLELDRIDANTLVAGDQAFSWIGSNAFSGTAGQLRGYESGGTWYVEGDVNGDSVADLVIALTLQGPAPLGAGDFVP